MAPNVGIFFSKSITHITRAEISPHVEPTVAIDGRQQRYAFFKL